MKKLFLLTTCVATICLVQACSSANEATTADSVATADTNTMSTTGLPDSVFVNMAAMGGKTEVELSNLALLKSTNAGIKDFATMMVTDHTKANEELMAIARNKNITVPAELDAEHKAKVDSLRNLSGAAFDRGYAATMVADHQKTLALLQNQASGGFDANIKDFAAKTATVVQMHLEHAQTLQAATR